MGDDSSHLQPSGEVNSSSSGKRKSIHKPKAQAAPPESPLSELQSLPPPAAPPSEPALAHNTEAPPDSGAPPACNQLPEASPPPSTRPSRAVPTATADPRLPPVLIPLTLAVTALLIFAVNHYYDGAQLPVKSYLQRGEEAVAQQDWPAALGALQKVPESNRERPGFLRLLADYLIGTRTNPELLANTLEKLKPSDLFRKEDHLWLCSAWLNTPYLDRARTAFEAIPPDLASGLQATQLNIELLRKEGQKREALQIQEAMERIFTADPVVAVQHTSKEWNSPFPEVRQKARERLWDLALRHDAPGLTAIRTLNQDTTLTRTESGQLLLLTTQHPDSQTADRLRVVSLQMSLQPEHRQEMIQAEVKRHQSGGPAVLAQLSSWLSREKEPGLILQLIPETRWKEQSVLLPLVVQALVDQARWQDLLSTLHEAETSRQFSKAQLLNWRAQALKKLQPEDATRPREVLDSAIRQGNVEKSYLALMTSAQIAEDWQLTDLALQAYQFVALPGAPQEAGLLEKCAQMAALLKDSDALSEAAVRLAALQPSNTHAAHRAAYMRLLRGEMLETALPRTSPPAKDDSTAWLLAALKAWRLGDTFTARDKLRHIHDSTRFAPGERAIYAGLLAKVGGDISRAFQVAEKIRPELLLPEELTFLKMAL